MADLKREHPMKQAFRGAVTGFVLALGALGALGLPAAPAAAQAANAPLYRQLMEVNGVARNVRAVVTARRAAIVQIATERNGGSLNPQEQARLDAAMSASLDPLTEQLLNNIAQAQSAAFSDADLRALIAANGSAAAGRYNAAKFADAEQMSAQVQQYMVDAVLAIIRAYRDGAASPGPAVIQYGDAAEAERVRLVRRLFVVDGTEALVTQFVGREHMKLIIQEVANHIDFSALSEDEKVRLANIAATEQANLIENVLNLNARNQARLLTRADLETLIAAFDVPAQQALTRIRLEDTGDVDREAEVLLQAAAEQIIADFESGQ